MKTCKECGKEFPVHVIIDGKKRNLQRRHYCLDCVPFGTKRSKPNLPLRTSKYDGTPCKCKSCGREYIYYRKDGHTLNKCNSCMTNGKKEERKEKAVAYLGGKCSICGYNKCIAALEFHHINPDEKELTLSGNHGISWERYKKELDKCILLCSNCHRELHYS